MSALKRLSPNLQRLLRRCQGWKAVSRVQVVPRKEEHAREALKQVPSRFVPLPENVNPVKHPAVMSSWRPDPSSSSLPQVSEGNFGSCEHLRACTCMKCDTRIETTNFSPIDTDDPL